MIKTDYSYEEKNILKYEDLVDEAALIVNIKGEYALLNIKTGKYIMPFAKEQIIYEADRNWFTRISKNGDDEYLSIYSVGKKKLLINNWRYVVRTTTNIFPSILENPKNGKKRFFRKKSFGKPNNIFQHEYADIKFLNTYKDQNYYAVSDGKKYGLFTEQTGVIDGYIYDDIEEQYGLIIFRKPNENHFVYSGETYGNYDSITYERYLNEGFIFCKKGDIIQVFYHSSYGCSLIFSAAAKDIKFLNHNAEAAKKVRYKLGDKAQYLFGIVNPIDNKTTIHKIVLGRNGTPLTQVEKTCPDKFDKVLSTGTYGKYVTVVENDGYQGMYADDEIPDIVSPKYEKAEPIFDGRYCLGYHGDLCDIVGKSGHVIVKNAKIIKNGESIQYTTRKSAGIADKNRVISGYDKVEKSIGNYYICTLNGNKALFHGSIPINPGTWYQSIGLIIDTNSNKVIYIMKKPDGFIDVVNADKHGAKQLNTFNVTEVKTEGNLIVLRGPNRTVIRTFDGKIIKIFQKSVQVDINKLNNGADCFVFADGLDYKYDSNNKIMNLVPMETTVVYTKEYVGEFGTVFVQSLNKEEFDEQCSSIESLDDESFEQVLRQAFIAYDDIRDNPRYMGLKRKL